MWRATRFRNVFATEYVRNTVKYLAKHAWVFQICFCKINCYITFFLFIADTFAIRLIGEYIKYTVIQSFPKKNKAPIDTMFHIIYHWSGKQSNNIVSIDVFNSNYIIYVYL